MLFALVTYFAMALGKFVAPLHADFFKSCL